MLLSVAGISHHTAPLDVREQAALGPSGVQAVLGHLSPLLHEAVVLSTCNRTELYVLIQEQTDVVSSFEAAFPDTSRVYRPYLFAYEGEAVARHLFRVASGVDSLVFGEAEILGQVRRAWEMAHAAGTTGTIISRLFQQALAVGKRIRSQTYIGRFPASVSSAAVSLAQRVFGQDLSHSTVLVIGAGEVGQGVARCLLEHSVKRLLVANHHNQGARDLAERHDATAVPWPIPPSTLAQADIIISSTGAQEVVIRHQDISAAMAFRGEGPLHLIDLALPRDIDPAVSQLSGVHLHNLDDIESVVSANVQQRQQTQPEVEAIVLEETGHFGRWLRERGVSSTIHGLRAKSETIRLAEMGWALPKLSGLSERERAVVEQLTSRLVNKLLHIPTARLRGAAAEGRGAEYRRVAQELFDLSGAASALEPVAEAAEDGDSDAS